MEIITNGYNRKCKNSNGGVKLFWLLKWQKYNRSQIVTEDNFLTEFPDTFIFRFESVTSPIMNEEMKENENGKYYEQSINSLSFKAKSSREFDQLIKNDYRAVVLDNNGIYRIFGLYNGLRCAKIDSQTGQGKSDFSGYSFSLNGLEEKQSFFISDLTALGLIEEEFYLLLQNDDFIITQNNNKLIFR